MAISDSDLRDNLLIYGSHDDVYVYFFPREELEDAAGFWIRYE